MKNYLNCFPVNRKHYASTNQIKTTAIPLNVDQVAD